MLLRSRGGTMMELPARRLIIAYALDWIVIIGIAAIGGGLNFVPSRTRPISLLDLTISMPLIPESISVVTLALVSFLGPVIIIFLVTLFAVPGPALRKTLNRSQLIRRMLWELHVGWAGLALSTAVSFLITQGIKNIVGKPRPHFLALCNPDLSNIAAHVVGGYGQDISARWTLVDPSICTQPDASMLRDGFRSFPSGHCSWSWAGLLYLSLWLSAKFSVTIPYLPLFPKRSQTTAPASPKSTAHDIELFPLRNPTSASIASSKRTDQPTSPNDNATTYSDPPLYTHAAAPPVWGIIILLIPLAAAAYISATRYSEFWHFGFDVLGGTFIGILTAWGSFRLYHPPLQRGEGWAWGPRSKGAAFGVGVGRGRYVDDVV